MSTPNKRELISRLFEGINRLARIAYAKGLSARFQEAKRKLEDALSALDRFGDGVFHIQALRAAFLKVAKAAPPRKFNGRADDLYYVNLVDSFIATKAELEDFRLPDKTLIDDFTPLDSDFELPGSEVYVEGTDGEAVLSFLESNFQTAYVFIALTNL